MKWPYNASILLVAILLTAGCSGTSVPRDTAPADLTTGGVTTEVATTAESAPGGSGTNQGGGSTEDTDPPGVPGSPIDYVSEQIGAPVDLVKGQIEAEIEAKCGPGRCGITVVIAEGTGGCASKIGPDPVPRGKTVTIERTPCDGEVTEETTTTTSETTVSTSETTAESTTG